LSSNNSNKSFSEDDIDLPIDPSLDEGIEEEEELEDDIDNGGKR
jgi:hypothetical protein